MKELTLAFRASFCLLVWAKSAPAQDWPQQLIHIIVSYNQAAAPIVGRILADAMQDRLGKPIIVANKPAAGGITGNEVVANATVTRSALSLSVGTRSAKPPALRGNRVSFASGRSAYNRKRLSNARW